jgi:NAD(P)-dependent dehydrogenase (short-subunit alcohol dehydrogenase family)
MANDLEGKTFLVTGANTGIGRVTAIELARRGGRVWLACRSESKTRPVLDEIKSAGGREAAFLELDLADLASVKRAASAFLASGEPLDVLINNAGVAGQRGATTKQGFELTFGVNHLGHFLLTNLLTPKLRARPGARVVSVASKAHASAKGIPFDDLQRPTRGTGFPEYQVSKLCNVLFTRELARREASLKTYALHPGVVASDVWRNVQFPFRGLMKLFMISNEDGAKTTLHCATSPEVAGESGRYYDRCTEARIGGVGTDDALARTLWEKSEGWTAAFA